MKQKVYITPLLEIELDVVEFNESTGEFIMGRIQKIVKDNQDKILDTVVENLLEKLSNTV